VSRYATALDLVPEPKTVLGTLLRPFSLGHHLLLEKLGSPYAAQPYADADADDLALAVFVCAAPYSETLRAIFRAEWTGEFKRWAKSIRRWRRPRFDHATEAAKFAEYLTDGYARPPVWRHETKNAVQLSAPWECLLKVRLVQGGFSEIEALEKYLPAAWYDYYTLSEIRMAENCTDPTRWQKLFFNQEDLRH